MKRNRLVIIMLILVLVLLTGCGSKRDSKAESSNNTSNDKVTNGDMNGGSVGFIDNPNTESTITEPKGKEGGETKLNDSARKLIRKIAIEYDTLKFEDSIKLVKEELKKSGGYIENSSMTGSEFDNGSRYAKFVMRIPVDKADAFISIVGENMYQISLNDSSEDVTLAYVDTESELKALKIQQERLLALLEKADKIEDIIALEERLSIVRYQLEQNASIIRTYDNLIEYATLTLSINEVIRITPPEPKSKWERMTYGFNNTLINIRDGFVEFGIWFVINLPYLLFWGIVICVSSYIFYKKTGRTGKKKETVVDENKKDKK